VIAETDNNFEDISLDEVAESGVEIDDTVPKQIGARTDPLQLL